MDRELHIRTETQKWHNINGTNQNGMGTSSKKFSINEQKHSNYAIEFLMYLGIGERMQIKTSIVT